MYIVYAYMLRIKNKIQIKVTQAIFGAPKIGHPCRDLHSYFDIRQVYDI